MRIKFVIVGWGLFLIPILSSYAQYAEDALRYSGSIISGSARIQGMGGAQTALGGDITSISGNPAGLGFFRKSEWSITPSLLFANTNSTYLNNPATSSRDGKVNFNIANLGIVFSNAKDDLVPGKWRGGSFGLSYTRTNNFQNQFSYQGTNNQNSFLDFLVEEANGAGYDALDLEAEYQDAETYTRSAAAYNTFLINPLEDSVSYYRFNDGGDEDNPVVPIDQRSTVNTSGAQNQWNFSYGGNYADKLYFGASVGISRLRYVFEENYREDFIGSGIINNFRYRDNLDVRGTGINFSLGLIYRINDVIRIGASATSPTLYRISERFTYALTPNFQNVDFGGYILDEYNDQEVRTIQNEYEYNLTTPFRLSGGVAFFLQKSGFITADVEYVTYNGMRLRSDDDYFSSGAGQGDVNFIRNNYRPTINARVGGEFRQDIFRFRAGFAYQGDPYETTEDDINRERLNFTAGVGVRLPAFYVDAAAVHTRYMSGYTPYTLSGGNNPSAEIKHSPTTAVLTFGVFF